MSVSLWTDSVSEHLSDKTHLLGKKFSAVSVFGDSSLGAIKNNFPLGTNEHCTIIIQYWYTRLDLCMCVCVCVCVCVCARARLDCLNICSSPQIELMFKSQPSV